MTKDGMRQWIKRFVPPILLDLYRSYRGYIWEGVYQHYRDVPSSGAGYESERLVKDTLVHTHNLLAISKRYRSAPTETIGEHALLPLLVSAICEEKSTLRVLDFGGGMGIAYVHLVSSVVNWRRIDYHIVENNAMCDAGKQLFANDAHMHFHSTLPANLSDVDIVYVSSALQYIEDYRGLLKVLCSYQPRYFLFVKLSSGNIPTYATAQKNLPGTVIPYWFLNVDEITNAMAENGYCLIFKSALEREYDQSNFPKAYRLGRACNLLFSRVTPKHE
jgi:putative methyltransferase (TIGR04325 family)